eukprot:7741374-Pyramimonas_sp.AAC.1
MVALYLILAKKAYLEKVQKCSAEKLCAADVVTFDASRVSSKEVLGIHILSHGSFVVAPLSVLADQSASLDVETTIKKLSDAVSKAEAKSTGKSKMGNPVGTTTKLTCLALFWSLFQIMPFRDTGAWTPSVLDWPSSSTTRCYDENAEQFFNWNRVSGSSSWALPPSIWPSVQTCCIRLLILLADEGSPGFSMFWFLLHQGLRVLFFRDPPHRMSNAFVNSMRGVRRSMRVGWELLVVHKYRRAPFGSGRMWTELKETLLILRKAGVYHPALRDLATPIARDKGLAPDGVVGSKHEMNRLMDEFLKAGRGQRVETRRWWTLYDGNKWLDGVWHLILAGLVVQFYIGGVDPWKLAMEEAAIQRGSNDDVDEAQKEFHFKVQ